MGLIGKTLNLRMNLLGPSTPRARSFKQGQEVLRTSVGEISLGQTVMTPKPGNPSIIKEDLEAH